MAVSRGTGDFNETIIELAPSDPLPFLDVEHPDTQAHLSAALATRLVALGYSDNLDVGDVRNRDRRLSRAIAEWAYTATTASGEFVYSGIRYLSRVDTSWECWAIFDGTEISETARRGIEVSDPDLVAIAARWDLPPY